MTAEAFLFLSNAGNDCTTSSLRYTAPPDRCNRRRERVSARYDHAARRRHFPTAVMARNRLDPAEARQNFARHDLENARATLDQRGAAIDVAHDPSFKDR